MKQSIPRPRGEEASTRSTYEDPKDSTRSPFIGPVVLGADLDSIFVAGLAVAASKRGARAEASLQRVKITSILGSPCSKLLKIEALICSSLHLPTFTYSCLPQYQRSAS